MGRTRHGPEQILAKLREAEVELSKGKTTGVVCRTLGITEQTYYRWRRHCHVNGGNFSLRAAISVSSGRSSSGWSSRNSSNPP